MKKEISMITVGLLAGCLGGCASLTNIPLGAIYTNVRTPRAYRSATPIDVQSSPADPVVTGQGCHRSILYLVAWGDTGYARAVKNAKKDDPTAILYDVQIDNKTRSVLLGLYQDSCTILTGRLGHQPS